MLIINIIILHLQLEGRKRRRKPRQGWGRSRRGRGRRKRGREASCWSRSSSWGSSSSGRRILPCGWREPQKPQLKTDGCCLRGSELRLGQKTLLAEEEENISPAFRKHSVQGESCACFLEALRAFVVRLMMIIIPTFWRSKIYCYL